jgi:retron-type reverse transcriptase
MATSTTTIRTTTCMSGAFVAESDRLYSFRSLHDAYISCRRRKRNTINALRFEASLLDNLADLGETLSEGTYKPSRSVCFVAKQPKHREIFAADFRDRVVHHLLVPHIEKIFEPKFIHDSYACRVGKGTHAAVERLKYFMNRVTKGGRVAAWFMQLDIRSFFMSIDREILLGILEKNIRNASFNNNPLHPPKGIDNPLAPFSKGEYLNQEYATSNSPLVKGDRGGCSLVDSA